MVFTKLTKTPYLVLFVILLSIGITSASAITITLGGTVDITEILNMMGNKITNVGTPTAPSDAATKAYVDSASGTDTLASLGCSNGEIAQFVGSVWICVADPAIATDVNCVGCISEPELDFDTATQSELDSALVALGPHYTNSDAIAAVGPHTVDTDTLAALSCSADQIPRWDGGNWVCATVSATLLNLAILDSTDDVGAYTSIAIGSDNFPVISYYDFTNTALKLVHCINTSCSGGVGVGFDTPVTLDSTDSVGQWNSIAISSDNFPVISYWDQTNGDLKLVHCTNTSCSTNDTPITLDSADAVGEFTSIAIGSDNFPVISYYDNTNQDLKLVHCTNASCSGGEGVGFDTPVTLDSAAQVGVYTSIAIGSDGFPVISYRDFTSNNLKLVHCTNVSCSTNDTPIILDSAGSVGQYASIAIGSDGFPVISYFDFVELDDGALKVAHCTNVSCSTNDTPITLDSTGEVGFYTSIAIGSDGFPVISYFDDTSDSLKLVHCTNVSCSTNDTPIILDSTGTVGQFTSIAIESDNLPVISYWDATNGDLKFSRCTVQGNCAGPTVIFE